MTRHLVLSETPSYLAYGGAVAEADYEAASRHARATLERARELEDQHASMHLLCAIGDAEARLNRRAESDAAYAAAVALDPSFPLCQLLWARCVATIFQDEIAARERLEQVYRLLEVPAESESEERLRRYYKTIIEETREAFAHP